MFTASIITRTSLLTILVCSALFYDAYSGTKSTCSDALDRLASINQRDREHLKQGGWICGTPRLRAEYRVQEYCGQYVRNSHLAGYVTNLADPPAPRQ
jgi:hypothetical protein